MANKPATLCQLEKGKLVDTQKGFVDTFNWAVQSIANLKGGENCEVSWPTDDTPTIDCTAAESDGSSDSGGSGGGSGGGNVVFTGTDGSTTDALSAFTFASALSSNVEVTCAENTITIGVYYI